MKNNSRTLSPTSTATTSPGDRYLFRIRIASLISFRSGPVNGVTRFNSKNPFTHPRINQKHPTIVLARILCLNRYTTRLVVKIKNALYKKIRGFLSYTARLPAANDGKVPRLPDTVHSTPETAGVQTTSYRSESPDCG